MQGDDAARHIESCRVGFAYLMVAAAGEARAAGLVCLGGNAQRYLDEGHPEKVREAPGGELDLKMMYPERTQFHVTEAAALWGMLGEYRLAENDVDGAQIYLDLLSKLAPDHPITSKLSMLMLPHVLKRGLLKLGGMGRGGPKRGRDARADPQKRQGEAPFLRALPDAAAERPASEPTASLFRQGSHTPKKDRNRKGRRR